MIRGKGIRAGMKNRPSSHLLILLLLWGLTALAYFAIYRAGVTRGFTPSLLLAARDLLLFLPIFFTFLWLTRRHRYAGDWTLFTAAILLFSLGQVMQYRLFTDPEYSANKKSAVRLEKMNTLRLRFVNEHYDAVKKQALFGDPNFRIPVNVNDQEEEQYWTFKHLITSLSTWILLAALL